MRNWRKTKQALTLETVFSPAAPCLQGQVWRRCTLYPKYFEQESIFKSVWSRLLLDSSRDDLSDWLTVKMNHRRYIFFILLLSFSSSKHRAGLKLKSDWFAYSGLPQEIASMVLSYLAWSCVTVCLRVSWAVKYHFAVTSACKTSENELNVTCCQRVSQHTLHGFPIIHVFNIMKSIM